MPDQSVSAMEHQESSKLKAYATPKVVEYGSLRDVTLSVGGTGSNDSGGAKSANKTQV